MNKNIKELALEAGGSHYPEVNTAQLEYFAKLIVLECARIGELKEQGNADYDTDTSVGWYMRQHFGIE